MSYTSWDDVVEAAKQGQQIVFDSAAVIRLSAWIHQVKRDLVVAQVGYEICGTKLYQLMLEPQSLCVGESK